MHIPKNAQAYKQISLHVFSVTAVCNNKVLELLNPSSLTDDKPCALEHLTGLN